MIIFIYIGSTETLTYLLVRGLGSAHYPEFGGSNPPVSIGEHGKLSTYSNKSKNIKTQNLPP